MFGFARNWFASKVSPIGVDFGTNALRLAQVEFDGTDFHLIAAATADVPTDIRKNTPARMAFFTQTLRDLLAQGCFRGRKAVLGLPSAWTSVQHLQMSKKDSPSLSKALARQVGEKSTVQSKGLMLRHLVAGQRSEDDQSQSEVIVMTARQQNVNELLRAAGRGRLDVTALTVETVAIVDCFGHVYRRKADAYSTFCYLDIGSEGTRIVIARGGKFLFMRNLAIGGEELNSAVGAQLNVDAEDARLLRQKATHAQAGVDEANLPIQKITDVFNPTAELIDQCLRVQLDPLIAEIRQCRHDHEATFPNAPVDRIIFCGGESRSRFVYQYVASAMDVPCQLGDPMVRLSRSGHTFAQGGIDRRQSQPAWAVALGLTMGSAEVSTEIPAGANLRMDQYNKRSLVICGAPKEAA